MFEKGDSTNRQYESLLLSASFTAKFELVFVLTLENTFSWMFRFKANRKSIGSSKNGTNDFQNSPKFERSTCFYVTIKRTSKQTFWKTKTFFKKLDYCFLVEIT